jgi:1-acylglycerone phosphate reductase
MSPVLDIEYGKASKLFDVNVFAPISVVKAFIPLLIVNKGSIVNIGSYADALPLPWQGVYNASKAALRSLTDNLRLELRPFNVKVVYVRPLHISFYCMEKYKSNCFIDCRWRHSE